MNTLIVINSCLLFANGLIAYNFFKGKYSLVGQTNIGGFFICTAGAIFGALTDSFPFFERVMQLWIIFQLLNLFISGCVFVSINLMRS